MLTCGSLVRAESDPTHPDLDYSAGLTLLTVRPQLLLASLHQLVIMLGLRLSTLLAADEGEEDDGEELDNDAFTRTFVSPASRSTLDTVGKVEKAIEEELRVIREVMEKTKALESKVSYQVKKLVALASTAGSATQTKGESSGNKNEDDEEEEQDQLSYKPNVGAILSSKAAGKSRDVDQDDEDRDDARAKRRIKNSRRSLTPSDEDDEQAGDGIYRPPRLGAIPYNEGRRGEPITTSTFHRTRLIIPASLLQIRRSEQTDGLPPCCQNSPIRSPMHLVSNPLRAFRSAPWWRAITCDPTRRLPSEWPSCSV